ncbi:ATP-binding cassette sub-family A member 9 [Fusarium albosuccineum]|uniref:ATP-binding cassette sub-family A member 9 n=1 Tax=Fusarium albosuccineum TaxID=1237068 RepID=A0A8H4PH44_9HYPO|nr:ATP-binding cassette sub-family A member 9 [Fusarium albosuccineum]
MFSSLRLWFRQTLALTRKIFLISVVRHWLSTLIRSFIIPILILVLVLEVQNFIADRSRYGVGSPSPTQNLSDSLPHDAKLLFVQPPKLGSDVAATVKKITDPLKGKARIESVEDEAELLQRCPTSLNGVTDCYAAIIFNDSPLSSSGNKIWNYTIRVSSARSTSTFDISKKDGQRNNDYAPLQLAVENAMTNSTTIPDSYMFTRITQDEANELKRRNFAAAILGGLGLVCFLSMISSVFHVIGMVSTERESGMAQLIDVMTGGAASARVLSYVIAFDVIYLPCWIIFGALYAHLLTPTSNAGITILWQILSGWALTSASVFFATVNVRHSAIYVVIIFVLMATLTELLDSQPEYVLPGLVMVLSAVFPSANYIFFLNLLCRHQKQGLPTNISARPPNMEHGIYNVTASMLWGLLLLSIIAYPLLAIVIEKYVHGVSKKGRSFVDGPEADIRPAALEIDSLTKSYKPPLLKRCCCCCRKLRPTIAVDALSFTSQKQQVLCLLGVNGSGKTTTMDLITGIQRPTRGSIRINAPASKIVFDHAYSWTMMKGGSTDPANIEGLIESCDLALKRDSPVGTLSGGQKRKVQLLCMLAGGSSVCLMDEVTTGMRSIILTTHFLDECEVLADKVVIVSHGHLKCQGTTAELKHLYGGGYRVNLPGVECPPTTPYPTTVHQGQTVFKTPDSTSAANLMASLESIGFSETSLIGPTMEDVFLQVAGEVDDADMTPVRVTDTSPLNEGNAMVDGQLTSGRETSFFKQLLALLIKRLLILRRGFWWYILALAIPLIFTPVFTAMVNYPDPFEPTACVKLEPTAFDQPWPIKLRPGSYYDQAGSDNISMLLGPQSINGTLIRSLSSFPFVEEYNMKDYTENFFFRNDLDGFLQYVRQKPRDLAPGAIYMGDKSNSATLAYNAELRTDGSMLMHNIWSQLHSRAPIALSFAYFSSSIPSDPGAGLILAIGAAVFELCPASSAVDVTHSSGPGIAKWYSAAYLFPIMLLYGIAAMLWSYIVSLYARSELASFGLSLCAMLVMFVASVAAFMVASFNQSPNGGTQVMDATAFLLGFLFPVANLFRAMVVGLNVWAVGCRDKEVISYPGSIYAYGGPILLLCLQVLYLFAALLWLDGQSWSFRSLWKKYAKKPAPSHKGDTNTARGIEMALIRSENSTHDLLQVSHVYKSFGNKVVVDDVSLTMGKSEIFALLGPNGAGKTTITNMIRGEMRLDDGSIYIQGVDIQTDTRAALRYIGVCPQFDALDQLSVTQQLYFYARVKGIRNVQKDVDLVMRKVGLAPFASRLTSKLSGGNKRKLSLAIALLGNPTVLILDEPSSAMDAISKREMWKMLSSISSGRSVLLTTHSMEEADVLATKVAILSKRILAAGTSQELRKRHSNVYEVHLVLATSPASSRREMRQMEAWVRQMFPGAVFNGVNLGGQIRFVVPLASNQIALPQGERSRVRQLIETLEEYKERMGIAYYTVGMGTLEMVFLKIVKECDSAEEDREVQKQKPRWKWPGGSCF